MKKILITTALTVSTIAILAGCSCSGEAKKVQTEKKEETTTTSVNVASVDARILTRSHLLLTEATFISILTALKMQHLMNGISMIRSLVSVLQPAEVYPMSARVKHMK